MAFAKRPGSMVFGTIFFTALGLSGGQLLHGILGSYSDWLLEASNSRLSKMMPSVCYQCIPQNNWYHDLTSHLSWNDYSPKGLTEDSDAIYFKGTSEQFRKHEDMMAVDNDNRPVLKQSLESGRDEGKVQGTMTIYEQQGQTINPGVLGEDQRITPNIPPYTPEQQTVSGFETPVPVVATTVSTVPTVGDENGGGPSQQMELRKVPGKEWPSVVQVYILASRNGGVHANLGQGGFHGFNNSHFIPDSSNGKRDGTLQDENSRTPVSPSAFDITSRFDGQTFNASSSSDFGNATEPSDVTIKRNEGDFVGRSSSEIAHFPHAGYEAELGHFTEQRGQVGLPGLLNGGLKKFLKVWSLKK